jgi:cytochrome c
MKKFFLSSLICVLLASCGGNESKTKAEEPKVADITKNPDYQKGLELASKSDCFTCHTVDDKLTGPTYRDVANKYASMPDTIVTHLAGKIITGGSGVWGEIMMTPHPALSQADAESIVRYILLLKK